MSNVKSLTQELKKYDFDRATIETLTDFNDRRGIRLVSDDVFELTLKGFQEYSYTRKMIPIFTDGEGSYVCVYKQGLLNGMVCTVLADDPSFEPKFFTILSFIEFLNSNQECAEIFELSEFVAEFEFPFKTNRVVDRCRPVLDNLLLELEKVEGAFDYRQVAYSIMSLTPPALLDEFVYPFVKDKDGLIQERAILLLGYHRCTRAKKILEDLPREDIIGANTEAITLALKLINNEVLGF